MLKPARAVLTCTEYVCSSALLDVLKPARAVRTCTEYVCSSAQSDVLKPARAVHTCTEYVCSSALLDVLKPAGVCFFSDSYCTCILTNLCHIWCDYASHAGGHHKEGHGHGPHSGGEHLWRVDVHGLEHARRKGTDDEQERCDRQPAWCIEITVQVWSVVVHVDVKQPPPPPPPPKKNPTKKQDFVHCWAFNPSFVEYACTIETAYICIYVHVTSIICTERKSLERKGLSANLRTLPSKDVTRKDNLHIRTCVFKVIQPFFKLVTTQPCFKCASSQPDSKGWFTI